MWKLDHEEGWAPKNWCFLTVVLEKTLEGPLDSKELKPVNHKGNQPWKFIARNKYWCSSWSSHTSATWCKEMTHWKRPWCCDRLRAWERSNRVWDGWMASLTHWTWVWANSGRWWRTAFSGLDNSLLEPYFLASHIFACPEKQGLYCCWLVLIFCYVDNPVTISPLFSIL